MNKWASEDTPEVITLHLSSLSFDSISNLRDIQKISIKIEGYTRPIYIGAWCYRKKKKFNARNNTNDNIISSYQNIDQSSLTPGRLQFIRRVLIWLVKMKESGRSLKTIKTNFGQFIFFLVWCDEQGKDFLSSDDEVVQGYFEYSEQLIDRYSSNKLSINSAHTYQGVVRDCLSEIMSHIHVAKIHSFQKIKRSIKHAKVEIPPNENLAGLNISLLYTVFDNLEKFLRNFELFPIKLKLEHDTFCGFPIKDAMFVPVSSGVGYYECKSFKGHLGYNFSEGRLSTYDEVFELMTLQWSNPLNSTAVKQAMFRASKKLEDANSQKDHKIRLRLSNLAMSSFLMLFISVTGMNLSQVSNLKMNDIRRHADKSINFVGYKSRAGDKLVKYYIGHKFYRVFERYLELRQWTIDTFKVGEIENIFFKAYFDRCKKIDMGFSMQLSHEISQYFNFNKLVKAKEWRVFKSHTLINKYGPVKAANILQHRLSTSLKHYSNADEQSTKVNFTKFFESFSDLLVVDRKEQLDNIAVGRCLSTGNPSTLSDQKLFAPDCKSHEGCLFCVNYRVHADLEDISKLLSYKKILSETRYLYAQSSDALKRHNTIIERITYIVDQIKVTGVVPEQAVKKTNEDIKSGDLSPYWQGKMGLLIDLDVV